MPYKKTFLMKIARNVSLSLGILCFLLNSLIYLYPEEVATPPIETSAKINFYIALHSLFITGIILIILSYWINKKKEGILIKEKLKIQIDAMGNIDKLN
jgi:hypothetical protein